MALSSEVLLPRSVVTQDGASTPISGGRTVDYVNFQFTMHAGQGVVWAEDSIDGEYWWPIQQFGLDSESPGYEVGMIRGFFGPHEFIRVRWALFDPESSLELEVIVTGR